MAVPSKNFTIIADTAIDADSPITADLMEDFRDNDIHLEEWLGLDYTAAQNHDHDGTNSARIALSAYHAQHIVDVGGASWSITTGALGFDPNAMVINWGLSSSNNQYVGWGIAIGTGSGDQSSVVFRFDETGPNWVGTVIDANGIMGLVGVATVWATAFPSEQADVTAWGSGAVTIATVTGAWTAGSANAYINVMIWGS